MNLKKVAGGHLDILRNSSVAVLLGVRLCIWGCPEPRSSDESSVRAQRAGGQALLRVAQWWVLLPTRLHAASPGCLHAQPLPKRQAAPATTPGSGQASAWPTCLLSPCANTAASSFCPWWPWALGKASQSGQLSSPLPPSHAHSSTSAHPEWS